MPLVMQIFIAVVIISAIVGAVAQFLSKLNEQQANAGKRAASKPNRSSEGGAVRQSANDVDRFLAEIDRLRRRTAEGTAARPEPIPQARPVAATRPVRTRPVAEPVQQPRRVLRAEPSFMAPLALIPSPSAPPVARREELPVAMVLTPAAEPTTVVTSLPSSRRAPETPQTPFTPFTPQAVPTRRSVPTPKTDFARSLVGLLGSEQGVPMAIVLTEIFGPPKARTMMGGERESR